MINFTILNRENFTILDATMISYWAIQHINCKIVLTNNFCKKNIIGQNSGARHLLVPIILLQGKIDTDI